MEPNNSLFIPSYYLVGIFLFIFTCCLAALEYTEITIFLCVIGTFIVSKGILKEKQQLFSLTLFFWLFSSLYGLSVPISIALGGEINDTFFFGNLTQNVNPFLIAYSLSCIGFLLGQINFGRNDYQDIKVNSNIFNFDILARGAILSVFFASLFEAINLYRIGGINMLFIGKGAYQSVVGDLFITLPSSLMYSICGIFTGMVLAYYKSHNFHAKDKKYFFMIILLLVPFLFCKILLGMRGALVSIFLTGMASYTAIIPLKKISWKLLLWTLLIYLFLVFLVTNRGIVSLLLTNPDDFFSQAFDLKRLSSNFNPGNSEFGAAFGNFCVFFEKYGTEFDKQFGITYLQGLATPIPSFLYPGDKPVQITYVFRDEFFSSWAQRSRIASTGFSSILEGYINGGFVGVLLVYLVWGKLLRVADYIRLKHTNTLGIILSSILADSCMVFSREAFGDILSSYLWEAIYALVIYFLVYFIRISFKLRM